MKNSLKNGSLHYFSLLVHDFGVFAFVTAYFDVMILRELQALKVVALEVAGARNLTGGSSSFFVPFKVAPLVLESSSNSPS